ncbi:hypothetical protein CDAR_591941, partial [Caerostris darwini]
DIINGRHLHLIIIFVSIKPIKLSPLVFGPCPWILDLPAKYAAAAEDRSLTVDENAYETVSLTGNDKEHEKFLSPLKRRTVKTPSTSNPEIPVVNSFTPLDQVTDMQTDDSQTTQNRMYPVMVNIADQNTKDITNLIESEFAIDSS